MIITEEQKAQVWLQAWCAAAQAYGIESTEKTSKWADCCLGAYIKRFGKEST